MTRTHHTIAASQGGGGLDRRFAACLGALLDALDQAALVFSREGTLLHETRAYDALAHCEQDALVVRRTARSLVGGVPDDRVPADGRPGIPSAGAMRMQFQTSTARYSLRRLSLAMPLGGVAAGSLVVVLVGAEPVGASVADVLRCRYGVTAREAVVAELIADGLTTPRIASELGISVHTVRRHHERLYRKLGVSTRVALAERVRRIDRSAEASHGG